MRDEALAEAERLFGRADFRRILVVSRLGSRGREEVLEYARERDVEILEFPDVLRFLIAETPTRRGAGSESEHVIRLMKVYGLVSAAEYEPLRSP